MQHRVFVNEQSAYSSHGKARNRAVLASLQPTCSTRAFRTVPPQELTDAAHKAARRIDTAAHRQTASRAYTRALGYQSRVWDPDD